MLSTSHPPQEIEEPPDGPLAVANPAAGGDAALLERVPHETLQVIDQLFPRPTSGVAFLALILRLARTKQLSHTLANTYDVAVITVQSIRVLAKLIGLSYETTHKYVVLFCALGLLSKHRVNGMVELRFPLYRYDHPDSLDVLDKLIADARHTVAVCARRVKKRYLVLYGRSSTSSSSEPSPAPVPQTAMPGFIPASPSFVELDATIHQVRELLQENGTELFRLQLGEVLARLLHLRGLLALPQHTGMENATSPVVPMATRKPTLSEHVVDSSEGVTSVERRLFPQKVDSAAASTSDSPQQGRLSTQKIDSSFENTSEKGRLSTQKVDSASPAEDDQRRLAREKSTSTTRFDTQKGRLFPQQVDSTPKKVDSGGNLNESMLSNVNVSIQTVIDSLNVNVRFVAAYLQGAFGEEVQKRGYYHNLYRDHKDTHVWLAAALDTLVGFHRTRTIRQPGRYFYDRCVALHRDGIPPELENLIQQYGSLSLEQIVANLCQVEPVPVTTSPFPQHSSRSGLSPASKPLSAIVLHIPRDRGRAGMSQQDAKHVYNLITTAVPGLRLRAYRQHDASYALLIDDGLRHPHQTWMYSLQECQDRLTRMHNVRDLFQIDERPDE